MDGRSALLALVVTVVLWGSAFAAIRVGLEGYGPGELACLRLSIASLSLALVAAFVRLPRVAGPDLRRLVLVGLTGMTIYQLLLNLGEVTVPAGVANVLGSTAPVFAALMSVAFLGERITRRGWVGTAVAFTGAALVSFGAEGGVVRLEPRAGLILGAALALASFFVLEKPLLTRYGVFAITAYATWIGALTLLPLVPRLPEAIAAAGTKADLAALYLGVGPSALGYLSWAYATSRVDVSFASSTLFATPVFAFGAAWLWQDEVPTLLAVLGGAVAVAGVAMTASTRRPQVQTNLG